MNESAAREEICRVGASLFARGYVHATAGNISLRLDDGSSLITPTDASLGMLDPARLAHVDATGRQLGGDAPSKTLALHRRIVDAAQRHDPATRCVIHTHSTHCVALSLRPALAAGPGGAQLLPALTPYFVMKVGRVPRLAYRRPGDPASADMAADAIERWAAAGAPLRAVMLERLGPNVWHATPAQAMAVLEELEETARLALRVPHSDPLDDSAIDELRRTFGARW